MNKIEVKQFDISEVDEITLLSVEEAKKLPEFIRACGVWWWLRSPGYYLFSAARVSDGGGIFDFGASVNFINSTVRPAFRINNLESETGDKVIIGKTCCTVVGEDLVLADYPICKHRFDEKSNNWETSELRKFINSEEFKAMI